MNTKIDQPTKSLKASLYSKIPTENSEGNSLYRGNAHFEVMGWLCCTGNTELDNFPFDIKRSGYYQLNPRTFCRKNLN